MKKPKIKLEKRELLFALTGGTIIILWFLLVKDKIAPFLINMPYIFSTLIYHIGFYIGIALLSSILVSRKSKIKISLITIIILTGIDLIDTPYMVNENGVLNTSVDYFFTTYDTMFYSIYHLFVSGRLLWWLIYPITGILLICVIPIIIAYPKIIFGIFRR